MTIDTSYGAMAAGQWHTGQTEGVRETQTETGPDDRMMTQAQATAAPQEAMSGLDDQMGRNVDMFA